MDGLCLEKKCISDGLCMVIEENLIKSHHTTPNPLPNIISRSARRNSDIHRSNDQISDKS